jgi:hypothetical protein
MIGLSWRRFVTELSYTANETASYARCSADRAAFLSPISSPFHFLSFFFFPLSLVLFVFSRTKGTADGTRRTRLELDGRFFCNFSDFSELCPELLYRRATYRLHDSINGQIRVVSRVAALRRSLD